MEPDRRLSGIRPEVAGLHIAKDGWNQRSYLAFHCEWLLRETVLDRAIAVAARKSQPRTPPRTYKLRDRKKPRHWRPISDEGERRLESWVYARWRIWNDQSPPCDLWDSLLAYQVPLYWQRKKGANERWGCIDLLGLLKGERRLVVVELKKEESSDTPLRALLEAGAYAVAVRKHWDRITDEIASLDLPSIASLSIKRDRIPLVLLAPAPYWDRWASAPGASRHMAGARQHFQALCEEFSKRGFPVRFGRLTRWRSEQQIEVEAFDFLGTVAS